MEKLKYYARGILLLVFAGTTFVIWYAALYYESRQDLLVHVFDVGQGDAIFIETPGGHQVLIDGGPGSAVLGKLGNTMPFWDRSLDLVILTHPDRDHLAGLLDVLRRYDVAMILWSGVKHSTAEYQEWLRLIETEEAEILLARSGQRLELGKHITLDIMAPFTDEQGNLVGGLNDTSVVGRLRAGNTSMLLMGDASRRTEYRLMFESPKNLDADILKVGHHGSKTSSSEAFLRMVTPDVAVISVGKKNRYGHPHPEVIDRLKTVGISLLRTDVDGTITFASDGTRFWRE